MRRRILMAFGSDPTTTAGYPERAPRRRHESDPRFVVCIWYRTSPQATPVE